MNSVTNLASTPFTLEATSVVIETVQEISVLASLNTFTTALQIYNLVVIPVNVANFGL